VRVPFHDAGIQLDGLGAVRRALTPEYHGHQVLAGIASRVQFPTVERMPLPVDESAVEVDQAGKAERLRVVHALKAVGLHHRLEVLFRKPLL
jgi:hypothetical protein